MTEYGLPFEGVVLGDATLAPYSAAEWARAWKLMHGAGGSFPNYGMLTGTGDGTYGPLEVRATAVVSSNVEVRIGAALINGRFYETTAVVTLAINSNASGNGRIDTIVLRLDFAAQTIRLAVKQGTPAASPARPTLQQDTSFWEIPLADIAVANGFSTLAQTTITQRQRYIGTQGAGWQHVANPISYVAGGNYDLTSILIDGTVHTAVAVPFALTGNMLLQEVQLRHITSVLGSYIINWGLYFEDTNDGQTSENTLRKVASGGATGSTGGSANITLPATPTPQIIAPGVYWLVIVWGGGSAAGLSLGAVAAGTFDLAAAHLQTASSAAFPGGIVPQTINLSSYSGAFQPVAARLRGRVFGMPTVL